MSGTGRRFDAVLFDLGGVVFPSPFEAWAEYERELGIEVGFIRTVVARSGEHGAWARHERGEIDLAGFCAAFEAECLAAGPQGSSVSAAEVMRRLMSRPHPRAEMLAAIGRIREDQRRVGALTNNVVPMAETDSDALSVLGPLFDVIVESSVEGLRKPDPAIYHLACDRLGVAAERTVFLDDLGVNLKPARALGMHTIKVIESQAALAELADALEIRLT